MSIFQYAIENLGFLNRLVAIDLQVAQRLDIRRSVRMDLDRRLDDITKATIDSEDEWFLELVKRNPKCAIEVIKECDLDDTKSD
jgi:hypothetical protein